MTRARLVFPIGRMRAHWSIVARASDRHLGRPPAPRSVCLLVIEYLALKSPDVAGRLRRDFLRLKHRHGSGLSVEHFTRLYESTNGHPSDQLFDANIN